MIRIDILSPVGGRAGGIENVIKQWTENMVQPDYMLRVIHMSPGIKYLDGYEYAYAFREENAADFNEKLKSFVNNYAGFINKYGAPDICIATNWPVMCVVADAVRKLLKTDYKIVSWVHSRIIEYKKAGLGGVEEMLCADAHLCISRNNERHLLEKVDKTKVYHVGNPVKMQQFVEEIPTGKQLCYVGRLQDMKRVDIILEALYRAHYKWNLRIVGDGEACQELMKITEYLDLQKWVKFLGWKNNPWDYCKNACALVTASEYEGYMLTGAEAMSMGMTVISTPVEGLIDYLIPGENGYLFEKNNAMELAQVLDYIYEGRLPLCDRQVCRESVDKLKDTYYFEKIKEIIAKIRFGEAR